MISIKLTEDDFNGYIETANSLSKEEKNNLLDEFIFDEYRLRFNVVGELRYTYNVKRTADKVLITCKTRDAKDKKDFLTIMDFNFKRGGHPVVTYCNSDMQKVIETSMRVRKIKNYDAAKNEQMYTFLCVLSVAERYIMNSCRDREIIYKQTTSKPRDVKTSSKKPYESKEKDVLMLDDIIRYVSHSGIKHNMTCSCWGVRGHYRHYKNGRVVFIKSYKKGKDRLTAEPKDKQYILQGD